MNSKNLNKIILRRLDRVSANVYKRYNSSDFPFSFLYIKFITKTTNTTNITNILKISPPKTENFQIKNSDIFHISAQNIDCCYSLEPPRRGGSNKYPQSMLLSRNKKNNVYPLKPRFYYIKLGLRGSKLYRSVFVMSSEKGLDSKWKEKFFPFIDVPISEATQLLFTKLPQSLKVYQFALNIWHFMHTFAKGSHLQCLNVVVENFFTYLLCA